MKLSELETRSNLKMLIYGNAGSGKSCFAASFPYPMLFLDFDGKADSAALYHKNDPERLDGIDVRQLAGTMAANPIDEFLEILDKELIPQQREGALQYKTIVLDSITTFSGLTLKYIVKTNPGIKRNVSRQGAQPGLQDFGILKREFARLIPGLLSLPCNIVMLGHISTEKDELTGILERKPAMDGSFANELPIYFKEVWRSYVDDKLGHVAQTKSDYKFTCRSQIPGLPNPIALTYKELEKYL